LNKEQEYIKMVFNEETKIKIFNFDGLKYVAPLAASIGWSAKQTMEALDIMPENGARAGTSLRWILNVLLENDEVLQEHCKIYNIQYSDIDPRKNTLIQIVKIFAENNVKSIDIGFIFGNVVSYDFIDLVYAYRMGNIKDELFRE